MEARLHLSLLGTPQILSSGSILSGFVSYKAQALLYYLAVTGRPHSRQTLADLFWDKMRETDAAANLRTVLSNLRRLVGDNLTITRQTVTFNRDQPYWLDVDIFQAQTHTTTQAISDHVATALRAAVDLYCGDFLEGFYIRDAPNFEEWVLGQRERLRQLALQALYTLATYDTACARYAEAMVSCARLLALDPWHEDAHRQMMLLLAYTGQRSAALGQYEICRGALDRELGIKPSAQTTELYNQILEGTVAPPPYASQRPSALSPASAVFERHSTASQAPSLLVDIKQMRQAGRSAQDMLWQTSDTLSSQKRASAAWEKIDLSKLLARCVSDRRVEIVMLKDLAGTSEKQIVQRLQQSSSAQPHRLLETTCLPSYRNLSLRPVLDMLERSMGLEPYEPLPERFAKLLRILGEHGLAAAEAAPHLLALLALPPDECADLLYSYSSAQIEATLSALVSLIQALASKGPLVVLMNDIQWCDPATLRLIDLLATSGLAVPVLILLTNRAAFNPTLDNRLQTAYARITAA